MGRGSRKHTDQSATALRGSSAAAFGGAELLPEPVAGHVERFVAAQPVMDVWRRYPDVTEDEDMLTDRWDCVPASTDLAAFLRQQGVDAVVVAASQADDPWAMDHAWVRLPAVGLDVDLTARQFHNLADPPRPEHQDLPCPLVWPSSSTHPAAGPYNRTDLLG